jgi:hypothetical protein
MLFLLGGLFCWFPFYMLVAVFVSIPSPNASYRLQEWSLMIGLLAWWANPCFWIGVMLLCRRRWSGAIKAGLAATVLALLYLPLTVMNEGIPGLAYWVWLASMAGLLLAAVTAKVSEQDTFQSLAWEEPEECYHDPIEMMDERIRRMEPADAIHRPAGPGL